jgi:hypothetical protein
MGFVSIVLNIFTLLVVAIVFNITFIAFNKRKARDETWLQVFKRVWSSTDEVNKVLSDKEPAYGDLGYFVGYDWETVPSISRRSADKQDSLAGFMSDNQGKINRAGTRDWF